MSVHSVLMTILTQTLGAGQAYRMPGAKVVKTPCASFTQAEDVRDAEPDTLDGVAGPAHQRWEATVWGATSDEVDLHANRCRAALQGAKDVSQGVLLVAVKRTADTYSTELQRIGKRLELLVITNGET